MADSRSTHNSKASRKFRMEPRRMRSAEHTFSWRARVALLLVAPLALVLLSSSPSRGGQSDSAAAPPAGETQPALIQSGQIHGKIHITRRLTKRSVAPVAAAYHRGVTVPIPAGEEDFVHAELGRVAIYLESEQHLPSEKRTATLEQKDRRFIEDTVVVPSGSTVSFPNLDPVFHNVFSLSKVKSFDLGNYPQNDTRTVTFPKPGIVRVYCHLHPNMSASIVVTPNLWATTPQPDGSYKLSDIPAGDHTVVVWHKSAGFFREVVHVIPGKTLELDFAIPIGASTPETSEP